MGNKILIVDDEQFNREMLGDMLNVQYDILEAADGRKAINLMNDRIKDISVVLLDLIMPEVDGLYVLNIMKERGWMNNVPVIVISAEHSVEVETKALKYGVIDFIHKPFINSLVKQRIKNVLDLFTYRKKLEEQINVQSDVLEKTNILLRRQTLDLEQNNEKIMDVLGTLVETRNLESLNHIRRVKGYTEILANEYLIQNPKCGMSEKDIKVVVSASALHDIGKISLSDTLVLKEEKYTAEEFSKMTAHTTNGVEIVRKVRDVWDHNYGKVCEDICLSHHERWDGKGYPNHLLGDQIPLCAQIVGLAEVYEALTNKRSYREAFSKDKAYEMIINGECGAFNPKLIACFKIKKADLENYSIESVFNDDFLDLYPES